MIDSLLFSSMERRILLIGVANLLEMLLLFRVLTVLMLRTEWQPAAIVHCSTTDGLVKNTKFKLVHPADKVVCCDECAARYDG